MSRALEKAPEMTNARADYYARIGKHSMTPLWEVISKLLTREPQTKATPHIWKYDALRPILLESADVISAAEAERRVLVLENPSMPGASCITESLYAGLQLIMPGEVAPTHRHSAAALRFILEGKKAFTAINGEKAFMEPGDLILTPSWVWHDHGHEGDVPVVWMDGLDIPLVRHLGPIFAEAYPNEFHPRGREVGDNQVRYGANMLPVGETFDTGNSPVFHYPYGRTRDALQKLKASREVDPFHGIKMEYINPTNGGPVMPTMGCFMQLLPKGFTGAEPYRSTAAWVYSVVEGRGRTQIGDQTIEWQPRDVFVIPAWFPHKHVASDDAVLFSFTDKPVHDKLGLFREQRGNA
jgi:gentisate 1,2-dioxygenase